MFDGNWWGRRIRRSWATNSPKRVKEPSSGLVSGWLTDRRRTWRFGERFLMYGTDLSQSPTWLPSQPNWRQSNLILNCIWDSRLYWRHGVGTTCFHFHLIHFRISLLLSKFELMVWKERNEFHLEICCGKEMKWNEFHNVLIEYIRLIMRNVRWDEMKMIHCH